MNATNTKTDMFRTTVNFPSEIKERITLEANKQHISEAEVIRRCIVFALDAMEIDENPNLELILRQYEDIAGKRKITDHILTFGVIPPKFK